jgi:hypothetical protein
VIGEEAEPADEGVGRGRAEIEGIDSGLECSEGIQGRGQCEAIVGGEAGCAVGIDFEGDQGIDGEHGVAGAGCRMKQRDFRGGMRMGDGRQQIEQRGAGARRKQGEREVHECMMKGAVENDK